MSPLHLFRRVAIAEAVTWALLLTGMFLKYVTETTDLAVSVFGMVHGVVFIAYCLTVVLVGVDQRWSRGRLLAGLAASIPPFLTVVFDRNAERRGALSTSWRLPRETPAGTAERLVSWLLRNPMRGALAGVVAVAVLTGLALVVGPPVGQ
jgi:integral membrane protein